MRDPLENPNAGCRRKVVPYWRITTEKFGAGIETFTTKVQEDQVGHRSEEDEKSDQNVAHILGHNYS